jgi:hypothetical protein
MAVKPKTKTNLWSGRKTQVVPIEQHPGKAAKAIRMKKAKANRAKNQRRVSARAKYASYLRGNRGTL